MEIKDFSKYSNAEKIVFAEQLWDSIAKNELEISDENEIEEFNNLLTPEKIERLIEDGKLIIDDYRINDYGEITEIEY